VEHGEIGGGLVEIVVADDPLRGAVAADLGGDVVLEIDIFRSLDLLIFLP
jgi:hypothetical protein